MDAAEVDLTLGPLSGDAPPLVIPAGRTAMESGRSGEFEYASYDEIYPPGPGREVAEQVCMACHGENFFPTRPGTERQWMSWIDHMVGSTLGEQDPTRYAQGLLSFRASTFRFGRQDRDDLLAYVVENFGPDSKRRRVAIEQQTPVDEEALGKAHVHRVLPAQGRARRGRQRRAVGPRPGRPLRPGPALRRRRQRLAGGPRRSAPARQARSPHRRAEGVPLPRPAERQPRDPDRPVRPDLAARAPRPHRARRRSASWGSTPRRRSSST